MGKFIFTTTGLISQVKFEGIGAYFNHPISAYTLSDYFDLDEIEEDVTIQQALDNNYITAVDENGNTISTLDYLVDSPMIFEIDYIDNSTSYIGYGEVNACKIQKIITTGKTSYNVYWADGNQNYNKLWSNRLSYTYF